MNSSARPTTSDDRISIIEINGRLFGVDILRSREVIDLPAITPVPNTREYVIGVFTLRGEIYPLIDISTILEMEPKKINSSDMVMILEGGNTVMGVIADRIHGVRDVANAQIQPAHGLVSKKMREFISGIVPDKSSQIYLLDVDRLFTSATIRTYY